MKINGKPDGGGSAVITGLSIISNGIYTAGSGVDGYSPVTVSVPSREFVTETLSVTENGTYDPSSGVDGFSQVSVNVQPSLQDKTISVNGSYTADQGYYGLSTVTVDVQPSLQSKSTSINGTITPDEGYYGLSAVEVNVQPSLQDKTISVNGSYTADQGYYGLSTVTVNVPPTIPVTEVLSVSDNGTYRPGSGVDGFSQVIVDVPQSVSGYTQKEITEGQLDLTYVNNNASFVANDAFAGNNNVYSVSLPMCNSVYTNAFYNCGGLSFVSLPICSNISYFAFGYCTALSNIYIPECTYLSEQAFYACNNLSNIDLPKCSYVGNYAFGECGMLETISLPECEYIAENALRGAFQSNTTGQYISLNLPKCSYIGNQAFYWTQRSLTLILGYNSVVELGGGGVFDHTTVQSVYVPESLVDDYKSANYWSDISTHIYAVIPDFSFSDGLVTGWASSMDSTYLTTLGITAGDVTGVSLSFLTDVASSTFMNHSNLVSLSIPEVTEYKDDTFNGCSALTSFELGVSALGDRVFANCTSLETVNINYDNDVITAGSDIFSGCTALTSINVPYELYDSYLSASGWSEYSSLMVQGLPELAFSNGVILGRIQSINGDIYTSLGIDNTDVLSVNLPNCKTVGARTFENCYNMTSFSLPEVEWVGGWAFAYCSALSEVNLPKCSYVGTIAFEHCYFSVLELPAATTVGGALCNECPNLTTISVPCLQSVEKIYGHGMILNAPTVSQLTLDTDVEWVMDYNDIFGGTDCSLKQGIGSIYTNEANYNSYITANGWSDISSIFVSIP